MSSIKSVLAVLVLAATSTLAPGPIGQAQETKDPSDISTLRISEEASRGIVWDDRRRAAARPQPLRVLSVAPEGPKPPTEPTPPVVGAQESAMGAAEEGSGVDAPLKWVGKVFFSDQGDDYVCSGQFIRENVVLTAAHCVKDEATGRYYDDFEIDLQYDRGKYHSVHNARCVAVFEGWSLPTLTQDKHSEWDYAMVFVDEGSKVGNMGWQVGWPADIKKVKLLGYPTDIASGEKVQVVDATVDPHPFGELNIVRAKHRNKKFQGGASGGAWVYEYSARAGKTNYVLSINSFGFDEDPYSMYGPYFTEAFTRLLGYADRGCKAEQ
jgi:hypothetical protein